MKTVIVRSPAVYLRMACHQQNNLTGAEPAECKVQQQTMNPWDEIPRRVRPSFALRSKRVNVISPSFRERHRGQRVMAPHPKAVHMTATVPGVKSIEKPLHWRAVPHMRKTLDATLMHDVQNLSHN
jgi:hypothetical protein